MMHTYVCAHCGGTFDSARDQEDAHAESVTLWGQRGDTAGMAEICDDCWQAFMAWHRADRDLTKPKP